MNNINALLFPASVISVSTQQGQIQLNSLINFKDLLNNLINEENKIELSNILNQMNSNPQITKSIYESIATLNLYGQLQEVASSDINQIQKNQIVNQILNNINLSPEEKLVVINSIRFIAQQIVKDNPVIPVISNVDENVGTQLNLLSTETVTPTKKANPVIIFSPNAPIQELKSNDIGINNNSQSIKVLPELNTETKIIGSGVLSSQINTINNENIVASKEQKIDMIGNNLNVIVSDNYIKPENLLKLKNQINDILILLSDTTLGKDNKSVQDEIINLKNYLKQLDDIINQFNVANVKDAAQLKNISVEISKIVNSVFASLINITGNLYSKEIYNYNSEGNRQEAINPIGKHITNNNSINTEISRWNSPIYNHNTENENSNLLKELIGKIFLMLKEMNGELYIGKRIEYVYKPTSSQSSQVTPDGILLINTASLKNFKEFIYAYLNQITGNKNLPNIVTDNKNTMEQMLPLTNNSNTFQAIKPIVSNPVSITHNYDLPKTFNIIKDVINQSTINTINKNYNSSIKNTIDEVNTYFVNFIQNKSEQKIVDAKVLEKIIDFSGKVRDDIVIKQVIKNISDAVKLEISEKIEVKMMLRPENLGPVIVKFDTRDNVINVRIDVATLITRDIIKANIGELKSSLNNLGFNVGNLEVSILNAYTSSNSQGNLNYFNKQGQQPIFIINNDIIEDIGVITGTDSYLNYLA